MLNSRGLVLNWGVRRSRGLWGLGFSLKVPGCAGLAFKVYIPYNPYINHYSSFHFLFHYPNITPIYTL